MKIFQTEGLYNLLIKNHFIIFKEMVNLITENILLKFVWIIFSIVYSHQNML